MSLNPPPKRLGRGLAALLGDAATPTSVAAPGVQALSVAALEPSPFQPRRHMDDAALQELADSISQRGILQPLLVRPKPGVEGEYQIIAGERRWRAAQRAQLHEVPVLVRELSDTDAMAAGLVENLQREDLNAVEEAMGYQRLLEEFKLTQDKLGEAIGKSRAHISHMLRMLKLPERVLAMVREGELSAGHARALIVSDHPLAVANRIVKEKLSVRQAEDLVAKENRHLPDSVVGKPPPRRADPETEALAQALSERLGLKVKVTFNGKGGTVMMNYKNLDQLDEVLRLLNS
ncbi:MAG: chromosome partitioning protein ParB [Acidocella sp. 20-57-95]|nr:MAG: chromosome partitioning protein ParB [Acidocella sp. 20-57-95]OYV61988.1 MAG: chromosome partitioning protein ParB [Acidocella sp. 21-58-7]HQT65334.1 ParB/RepB/Spo0J family partition protein [Acidocella sp.]HQU03979.1 ParB/RepB/Spo0J family partition protein [Acidocella sp.]